MRTVAAAITIPLLVSALVGFHLTVFAQDGSASSPAQPELHRLTIVFGSFLVAGLAYSLTGWVRKIRRALGGEVVVIEWRKLGKGFALGIILGGIAFFIAEHEGESIEITTIQEFTAQVVLHSGAIMYVDKLLIAAPKNVKLSKPKADYGSGA